MIGQTLQVEVACASLEVEVEQLKLYEKQLRASLGVKNEKQVAENENDQVEED